MPLMRAPDGSETVDVAPADVQHYLSLGATLAESPNDAEARGFEQGRQAMAPDSSQALGSAQSRVDPASQFGQNVGKYGATALRFGVPAIATAGGLALAGPVGAPLGGMAGGAGGEELAQRLERATGLREDMDEAAVHQAGLLGGAFGLIPGGAAGGPGLARAAGKAAGAPILRHAPFARNVRMMAKDAEQVLEAIPKGFTKVKEFFRKLPAKPKPGSAASRVKPAPKKAPGKPAKPKLEVVKSEPGSAASRVPQGKGGPFNKVNERDAANARKYLKEREAAREAVGRPANNRAPRRSKASNEEAGAQKSAFDNEHTRQIEEFINEHNITDPKVISKLYQDVQQFLMGQ